MAANSGWWLSSAPPIGFIKPKWILDTQHILTTVWTPLGSRFSCTSSLVPQLLMAGVVCAHRQLFACLIFERSARARVKLAVLV